VGAAQVQIPASQFFGAVVIPIVAHAPPMHAETHSPGVMVTQLEATPVQGKRTSAARARARVGVDAVRIWISGDPIAAGITCQKEPSTVDGSAPLRAPTSSAPLHPVPHVRQPVALRQDVHRHSA